MTEQTTLYIISLVRTSFCIIGTLPIGFDLKTHEIMKHVTVFVYLQFQFTKGYVDADKYEEIISFNPKKTGDEIPVDKLH